MSQQNLLEQTESGNRHRDEPYRHPLGDANLTAFLDGTVRWTMKDFIHDPERVALMMREQHETVVVPVSINAYLVVYQGEVILVDTGLGALTGQVQAS